MNETVGRNQTTFILTFPDEWFKKNIIIKRPRRKLIEYIPNWVYCQVWICKVLNELILQGEEWKYNVKKVGHKNQLFGITIKTVMYEKEKL